MARHLYTTFRSLVRTAARVQKQSEIAARRNLREQQRIGRQIERDNARQQATARQIEREDGRQQASATKEEKEEYLLGRQEEAKDLNEAVAEQLETLDAILDEALDGA